MTNLSWNQAIAHLSHPNNATKTAVYFYCREFMEDSIGFRDERVGGGDGGGKSLRLEKKERWWMRDMLLQADALFNVAEGSFDAAIWGTDRRSASTICTGAAVLIELIIAHTKVFGFFFFPSPAFTFCHILSSLPGNLHNKHPIYFDMRLDFVPIFCLVCSEAWN